MLKELVYATLLMGFLSSAQAQLLYISQTRIDTAAGPRLEVVNNGPSPIVALHLSPSCTDGTKLPITGPDIFDSLLNYGRDYPINPGHTITFRILKHQDAECLGQVDGMIFADGTAEGDPGIVDQILRRRNGIYLGIQTVLPLLSNISNGSGTPADVVKLIQEQNDATVVNKMLSADEIMGRIQVYSAVIFGLNRQADMAVPSDLSKHPLSTDKIMTQLSIPRQRAHAMVMARKLEEWMSDLDGHLSLRPTN